MAKLKTIKSVNESKSRGLPPDGVIFAGLLFVILLTLFWKSFLADYVHFSNDGPLAMQVTQWVKLPDAFTGSWADLGGLGGNAGSPAPGVTGLLRWALGPVGYAKFFQPIAMFILGLGAWTFFRQSKLSPLAAVLGGLAAGLQSAWFSNACWGVAGQQIAIGMTYFALALVVSNSPETPAAVRWIRLMLAGLCVGMNVMEGADNGAIFSLFIAAFVVIQALLEEGKPVWLKLGAGFTRTAVIAVFAAFLAAQTIVALVGIAVVGVAGTQQPPQEKWDFSTQWSLPKKETLSLFVPGLFGYRMDTPKDAAGFLQERYQGGLYWGGIGRAPNKDRFFNNVFQPGDQIEVTVNAPNSPGQNAALKIGSDGNINAPLLGPIKAAGLSGLQLKETVEQAYSAQGIQASVELPGGFTRQSGGGNYQGIVLAVIAIWAIAQSFRRRDSVFTDSQRKFIWFWTAICILAILLAWGRFASFYQLFYALPYSSAFRNPTKFVSVFSWAFLILFGYGVHGLSRRYLQAPAANVKSSVAQFQSWWRNVRGFDRKWAIGCGVFFAGSVVAWLIYASQKAALVRYLQAVDFSDKNYAGEIASFSIGQAGWFLVFFGAALLLCTLIIAGIFSGKRAKLGGLLLGVLLLADFVRADLPYVIYWNYPLKYQSNPIVDFLREKPYEYRVINLLEDLPFLQSAPHLPMYDNYWDELYKIEWIQQIFPYYNIQSLDFVQNPRMPSDQMAFYEALAPTAESPNLLARNWELSNNRYFLGPMAVQLPSPYNEQPTLSFLNGYFDPAQNRFRIVQRFDIVPKAGLDETRGFGLEQLTAAPNDSGGCALFEFTGVLPRAKLYSNWETNNPADLKGFSTNGLNARDLDIFNNAGTNGFLALKKLTSPAFDPQQSVMISDPLPAPTAGTNQNSGTVEFKSYSPKKIIFATQAATPAVLLLNDKYDPQWRVWVDGTPAQLLRANFIMRGVYLPAGEHTVTFYFGVPNKSLLITAAATGLGIILSCVLFFLNRKPQTPEKIKK